MPKLSKVALASQPRQAVTGASGLSLGKLRLVAQDGGLMLACAELPVLRVSSRAIQDLCGALGLPAGYVLRLPPTLAAQNINHALKIRHKAAVWNGTPVWLKLLTGPEGIQGIEVQP
jgi:hypothetical protein